MRNEKTPQHQLLDHLTTKPLLIKKIEDRLEVDGKIGINVAMEEGLILKSLCARSSVDKVVEIGTQYGCSASWMALGLQKGSRIFCFENDPSHIIEAQKTFSSTEFVELGIEIILHAGKALELLSQIETEGPFDLIFIDANKSGYLDYFNWARKNIKSGGTIVADNVYLFGTQFQDQCPENTPVKMWKAMRSMLEVAFKDPTLESSIVPTREGLLISVKKDSLKPLSSSIQK